MHRHRCQDLGRRTFMSKSRAWTVLSRMRKAKTVGDAMNYDHSIVVVKDGTGFELLYFNRLMGTSKIGPRLARAKGLPTLPTKAPTFRRLKASVSDGKCGWMKPKLLHAEKGQNLDIYEKCYRFQRTHLVVVWSQLVPFGIALVQNFHFQ